jgi:light-harvesting complex I chlorophyll a/b binding protein 1
MALELHSAATLGFAHVALGAARPQHANVHAVHMGVADLVGASTEVSNKVWDPLNLADKMDDSNLKLVRAAELKHGRVAMLANVGWAWMATGAHFDGMLSLTPPISFEQVSAAPNPLAAAAMVPAAGIWQMIAAVGALEIYWENKYPAAECAGNMGVPAVTQDAAKLKELELIELKHGRLAMIGIISYACAVAIPGSVPFYSVFF